MWLDFDITGDRKIDKQPCSVGHRLGYGPATLAEPVDNVLHLLLYGWETTLTFLSGPTASSQ